MKKERPFSSPFPIAEAERWNAAAEETGRHLHRAGELVSKRKALTDQRLALMRDVVAAARKFVDEATRHR